MAGRRRGNTVGYRHYACLECGLAEEERDMVAAVGDDCDR